jgi:hypothetical protein
MEQEGRLDSISFCGIDLSRMGGVWLDKLPALRSALQIARGHPFLMHFRFSRVKANHPLALPRHFASFPAMRLRNVAAADPLRRPSLRVPALQFLSPGSENDPLFGPKTAAEQTP